MDFNQRKDNEVKNSIKNNFPYLKEKIDNNLNKNESITKYNKINDSNYFFNTLINSPNLNPISNHNSNLITCKMNTLFKSIGIFYMKNSDKTNYIYYNILHRKISLEEGNLIDNFFFQDITSLINFQICQYEENKKKQKIFAKISHEFKTPLNSIIGVINIIKESEKKLSNFNENNLQIISNLSNYVIFLVSDIIQYVNINDMNDLKINLTNLNLEEILDFCFETLESLLCCNKIKLEKIKSFLLIEKEVFNFIAESDEMRIKQILLNFISNAVKFTKEGKIILVCKLPKKENYKYIKISVIDSGIGIQEKDKTKLFKDFGLIENDLKTDNNKFGSGLGLSICKNIADRLGIKISFESEYMKYSKFTILIPCLKKEDQNIVFNKNLNLCKYKNSDLSLTKRNYEKKINGKMIIKNRKHNLFDDNHILDEKNISNNKSLLTINYNDSLISQSKSESKSYLDESNKVMIILYQFKNIYYIKLNFNNLFYLNLI